MRINYRNILQGVSDVTVEKISIDKFKVSFIGDIRVLEQHSYDIKKKDLLISDC